MATYKSQYTGQQIDAGVSAALNPDPTPTAGSDALMTSGGVKSAIGNVISVLFETTVTLPDGTGTPTETLVSLASFLDAGGYVLKAFSTPMLGNYALPYSDGTLMRTYISIYDSTRNLRIINRTSAWNNYDFKIVLFCQKT